MSGQDTIAVIGAGVIGAAVAFALAREGHEVMLLDRAQPGVAGASFGNVGHIAAELVQPLPSVSLLLGFWRELLCFDGALDLPVRQAMRMLPWIRQFAAAALRRPENTRHLAPLVLPAAEAWARTLAEAGRPDLLRRNGHYEIAFGRRAQALMRGQARTMAQLGIGTRPMTEEELVPVQRAARARIAGGLCFANSAHVVDPFEVVRALAAAAATRTATFRRFEVRGLRAAGDEIEILGEQASIRVGGAVVCAGMGSQPLLASFGVHAPLQSVRGYHIELPGHPPFLKAPVVYTGAHVLVTPMTGRLRASSYMEFAPADAPADPRKAARLRQKIRALGYACATDGPSWVGARPVLPDYLPGIGRAAGPANLFYAVGHQHIGLTIAPITAELVADLVAARRPRIPVAAFDLRRFGAPVP
ncbi:MAG TPA: FAD-binding oxidoreductase [Steroidobacteraceae bacterium]|jgi:glycine/D-amino acid oxidase-like deaminating enzyme|nr:FAD-binding oxidoreductase [Steroidobacteraceae bacterium]